jgi:hypothetical protein
MKASTIWLTCMVAVGFIPSVSHAEKPNPWTDCGIGALVFSGIDGDGGKILAAISNITFDLGTTGVTSATSSPSTCAGREVTAAAFINQQLPSVEEELAMGGGEHVNTVLDIYQCGDTGQSAMVHEIRGQYASLLLDPEYHSWTHVEQAQAVWALFNGAVAADASGTCAS